MANRHSCTQSSVWRPTPTVLPPNWITLVKELRQQDKSLSHAYILDMRYNSQLVGDMLCSWGLPWQVVIAAYLWDTDVEQIQCANLPDTDRVMSHIIEANVYIRHIENENLSLLLYPPYRDVGALLIALVTCYQSLHLLQQRSNEQAYTNEVLSRIEGVGRTLKHISARLGLWTFKRDTEDIVEQLLYPDLFKKHKLEMEQILARDTLMLESTRQLLMASYQEVTQKNITVIYKPYAVTGMKRRLQDAFTTEISNKTELTGFDIVTFEVLVPTVRDCYEALGIFSQLGYIHDRVTDLVANPKPNGCSNIAFGLILKPTGPRTQNLTWLHAMSHICQLQISTNVMYIVSWYGCLYDSYYQLCMKNGSPKRAEPSSNVPFWDSKEGKVFLTIKENLSNDHAYTDPKAPIIVYDRNRKPFTLPKGATALDFAYAVSLEKGEYAIEAIVNNRKALLNRVLEAGSLVEIRTTREIQVQDYWLKEDYAITPRARDSIKESLNMLQRNRRGYYLLLHELERYRYMLSPEMFEEQLLTLVKRHELGTPRIYLGQLERTGEAPFTPKWAARGIIEQMVEQNATSLKEKSGASWRPVIDTSRVMNKQPFRKQLFCDLCQPNHPRDMKIMGMLRERDGELIVHKESCPHLIDHVLDSPSMLFAMRWHLNHPAFRVTFFLITSNRHGLLQDITTQLGRYLCNFVSMHAESNIEREEAWVRCTIEADTDAEAIDIWQELSQIEGVIRAEIDAVNTSVNIKEHLQKLYNKHNNTSPLESSLELLWDDFTSIPPRAHTLKNPFDISRPATAKMFFGRAQETRMMQHELCEGQYGRALVLYGPRRSGKTSICRNFLERQVSAPHWHVFFSLQNSTGQTEEGLLDQLTEKMCAEFIQQLELSGSDWPHYTDSDPQMRFRRVLQDCIAQVPEARLILALDEFGGALAAYKNHVLDRRFFTYWKELMDEVPQLSLVLALPTDAHTVLTQEFSHAFSFAETLPVAFLDVDSSGRLLVDPLHDQHIMIRPHTVTLATKLTGGNPYYMTLIGQRLIHRLNREKSKQQVTDEDLRLVVDQLTEEGSYQNFNFLRQELQCKEEFSILQTIVEQTTGRSPMVQLGDIAKRLNLPIYEVKQHLDRLRIGLILEENGSSSNPYYSFRIELVRLWLARNQSFFTGVTS